MKEQISGLWADPEAVLRPGPEEYYRQLITELEAEHDPEQLTLRWLRRLLLLMSPDEPALIAAIREAVLFLDERNEYLTDLIQSIRDQLILMGDEQAPTSEVPDIEPGSEAGWQAWLAQLPPGYKRLPLAEVALDDEGFPIGKFEILAATAEQEATEGAIFGSNRILAVLPDHVEELKPLLIRVRHQLSERNDKLGALFGMP